ncbi:MAG: hypothetical protein J6Q58_05080 [Clostridia bacterium]|nr:hypothetical protein [Clostridia bacterium]
MKNNFKIHFIGINGAGMCTLAKYLKSNGFYVTGSDVKYNQISKDLENNGIIVYVGHDCSNVKDADIVVYSSSINERNVEYKEALNLKKAIYKRGELLGLIFSTFKNSVGFSGSHGKTTATSISAHILKKSLMPFTSLIGGEDSILGNFVYNEKSNLIVSEVCEFQKNINYISPLVSAVLNIDDDHLDCYLSINELETTFFNYLDRAKYKVVCLDDERLKDYKSNNLITYAINSNADYKAENVIKINGKYSFTTKLSNDKSIRINLNVYGYHNIYNALVNIAIFDKIFKFDSDIIKSGIESFCGVKRRFEFLGTLHGINIYADYCHHPTEIKESLKVYNEVLKGDYKIVFQPHTYSRTKLLFNDFVCVLKNQKVLIYNTYPAREKYDYKGSAKRLAKALKLPYIKNRKKLKKLINIEKYTNNYIIFGAGDLYDILCEEIKNGLKN